jgi:glutaredoxin
MNNLADQPSSEEKHQHKNKKRRISGLLITLIILSAIILLSRREPVNTIDCTPEIMAQRPDIVMLGAWWCTYCYQAKKYFQRDNIHYCEYDMENTIIGKRLYEENGGGAVPIMLIGEYRLQGFDQQQIEEAISLLNKTKKPSK